MQRVDAWYMQQAMKTTSKDGLNMINHMSQGLDQYPPPVVLPFMDTNRVLSTTAAQAGVDGIQSHLDIAIRPV
jgi:hypothetical protein